MNRSKKIILIALASILSLATIPTVSASDPTCVEQSSPDARQETCVLKTWPDGLGVGVICLSTYESSDSGGSYERYSTSCVLWAGNSVCVGYYSYGETYNGEVYDSGEGCTVDDILDGQLAVEEDVA